jgi:hypothetical protein
MRYKVQVPEPCGRRDEVAPEPCVVAPEHSGREDEVRLSFVVGNMSSPVSLVVQYMSLLAPQMNDRRWPLSSPQVGDMRWPLSQRIFIVLGM